MRLLFFVLTLVCATRAGAQEVIETLGADAEVHDVLAMGAHTLLATSGGLLVLRDGALVQRLAVADGLPGARLRSLSLVGDEVYSGGVEGLAVLRPGDDDTLQVARTLPIRRARRVLRWRSALWVAGFAGLVRIPVGQDGIEGAAQTIRLGASAARRRLTDLLVVRGHGTSEELWVASAGAGVIRVDGEGQVLGRLTRHSGLRHDHVWDLLSRGDEVLIGTLDGVSVAQHGSLVRGHALTRASARLPVRDVRQLVLFESNVHAVTFGGGVRNLEGQSRDSELRAFAAAPSAEGMVIGHTRGASTLGGDELIRGGLHSADVTALAQAFGRIWIGTFTQGLATMRSGRDGQRLISRVSRASARYALDGRINDLAVTGRGSSRRLWIATDRGLFWHDGRRYVPVEAQSGPGRTHVTSLHVDADGDLWVTASRVLSRWSARRESWQHWDSDAGFPVAQLHAVTTRRNGDGGQEVWVGSLHGLYRFDPVAGHAEAHTVATGDLPVDWVTGLATLGEHLVVGTYHGGLVWERSGAFHVEGEEQGLPAGWVNPHAMKNIGGTLYVGTLDRGLLVGRRGEWTHLQVADGLPSDDVTDVLADGEHVWVATRAGLVRLSRE